MATLPTTTSEITAEWMTKALRGSGIIGPDVTVAEVIADAANAGVGFMGEVASVGVVYSPADADGPSTVVAKFPTQSPEIKAMMHPTRIYEREHNFYEGVAETTPLRTPDIFHITCLPADTPEAESYMLLMEDLSELVLGDQVAGTSIEQTRSAVKGLASHHATFWNGAGMEEAHYIPIINGPLNQAGSSIYEASLPGFMEAFGAVIDPALADFVANYAAARPGILDQLTAMPHTLVHFDFRADNLFFDTDGSTVVIDWQAISKGGGVADLGYFLSQNLTVDDRRAHEADLLKLYHDTLVQHGVTDYSHEQLLVDYPVGVACGWMIPVLAVGTLDFTSERAIALWTAVIERAQAALLDHGFGS